MGCDPADHCLRLARPRHGLIAGACILLALALPVAAHQEPIPQHVVEQGEEAMEAYLQSREGEQRRSQELKLSTGQRRYTEKKQAQQDFYRHRQQVAADRTRYVQETASRVAISSAQDDEAWWRTVINAVLLSGLAVGMAGLVRWMRTQPGADGSRLAREAPPAPAFAKNRSSAIRPKPPAPHFPRRTSSLSESMAGLGLVEERSSDVPLAVGPLSRPTPAFPKSRSSSAFHPPPAPKFPKSASSLTDTLASLGLVDDSSEDTPGPVVVGQSPPEFRIVLKQLPSAVPPPAPAFPRRASRKADEALSDAGPGNSAESG